MSADGARITGFTNGELAFDVRDDGPLDGTPVVLLHGFPERGTSWRHVAPLLHEHGARTFAPDQRGYSAGARPTRRRDYRIRHLVDDVELLIAEIGAPVHLVGHDWGAIVAWALAARTPQLLSSLTAVSVPHPAAFLRAGLSSSQALRSSYVALFQVPLVVETLARVPGGPVDRALRASGMSAEEVARFRSEIVEHGALSHALGWYRALPLDPGGTDRGPVQVPTTLVWSDGDSAIARRGVDLCGDFVDADYRLVVLEGVSHWIPTHAPEALAEAIVARAGLA